MTPTLHRSPTSHGLLERKTLSLAADRAGGPDAERDIERAIDVLETAPTKQVEVQSDPRLSQTGKVQAIEMVATDAYTALASIFGVRGRELMPRLDRARAGLDRAINLLDLVDGETRMRIVDGEKILIPDAPGDPFTAADLAGQAMLARSELLALPGDIAGRIVRDAYDSDSPDLVVIWATQRMPRFLHDRLQASAGVDLGDLRRAFLARKDPARFAEAASLHELLELCHVNAVQARAALERAGLRSPEGQDTLENVLAPMRQALGLGNK